MSNLALKNRTTVLLWFCPATASWVNLIEFQIDNLIDALIKSAG
ncbi:hypothetical protein [Aliikangiella coralliicola]|nr:hypothetical protein [Aliikangiella coralliicola]